MRPIIAIPMGDPAGIGPEILLKTAADEETAGMARCLAVGSRRVLENALQYPNMPEVTLRCVTAPEEGDWRAGVLNLIDVALLRARSEFSVDVDVEYGDTLLLLVTCDYSNSDGRFILALRRVRDSEDAEALRQKVRAAQ